MSTTSTARWLSEKLKECQAGDSATRTRVWNEITPQLWNFLIRIGITQQRRWFGGYTVELAEDAASHTLTQLLQRLDTFSLDNVGALLSTIVRNYCITEKRRLVNRCEVLTDDWSWTYEMRPDYAPSLSTTTALAAIIRELPEDAQLLLYRVGWLEMTQEQIAQIEGVTKAAITARLKRLRAQLRTMLEAAGYDLHEWAATSPD